MHAASLAGVPSATHQNTQEQSACRSAAIPSGFQVPLLSNGGQGVPAWLWQVSEVQGKPSDPIPESI